MLQVVVLLKCNSSCRDMFLSVYFPWYFKTVIIWYHPQTASPGSCKVTGVWSTNINTEKENSNFLCSVFCYMCKNIPYLFLHVQWTCLKSYFSPEPDGENKMYLYLPLFKALVTLAIEQIKVKDYTAAID